ncbi:hypothetical protein [Marinobacter maritimus]|uniref:hypothetical protein n=1 Tax=Marinobacter maritimus TaxID=277961 RepID=UPI0011A30C2E|nr:hypothetical protein [Marinobacter maritimus]|tara:strand:- start:1743 stop:1988 length:246 start_codon:yes stop_codon:yes gene_type:complete
MVLDRVKKGIVELKNYWTDFIDMVFFSVLLGLVYIGVSALAVDDLTSDDWLKDVTPIFVGLASVFVALTVLAISLKENSLS